MLVSFSACLRDEANALATLEWAFRLDGKLPYDCILSVGDGVAVEPIRNAAEKLFQKVTVMGSNAPDTWPQGKNHAFQNLVRYLDEQRNEQSFLWWEGDAIPLKKGWLAAIEAEHLAHGKAFTGFVHPALPLMECVGVYPPNFMEYSPHKGMLCRAAPWDRCCGPEILPHVHAINHLITCVHDVDGLPPTFPKDLKLIPPSAVLFHANKDASLVQELSKGTIQRIIGAFRKKPEAKQAELITVVFAVCQRDIAQAVHHARWLHSLAFQWPNKAVIAFDAECPAVQVQELHTLLQSSFKTVERLFYPTPHDRSYPAVANFAFARVAEVMARGTAPWLWFESDCVVLKRDWLETIQKEYDAAGKPFMGPVVKERGYGHTNGSAVYPADTVNRIPKALKQTAVAWDFAAKDEMNGDCHDASHLVQQLWGIVNGRASQTNGAEPPKNFTREIARRLILPSAVVMHRCKDDSLCDLLMAGGWK